MPYKTTVRAGSDIADLYAHGIRQFGIDRAERYVADLLRCFDRLAQNPRLARERRELTPPIRIHPHASHLIAYLVQDDAVLIVRVLDARTDWDTHFTDAQSS